MVWKLSKVKGTVTIVVGISFLALTRYYLFHSVRNDFLRVSKKTFSVELDEKLSQIKLFYQKIKTFYEVLNSTKFFEAKTATSYFTMEKKYCKHIYGDIALLQVVTEKYSEIHVANAFQSLRCYTILRNYTFHHIVYDNKLNLIKDSPYRNSQWERNCRHVKGFMMIRHCWASQLLSNYSYVVHIDGDSGVVNPHHCFEDYINPNVDLSFLIRAHSGEIQAGHYIAKSTDLSKRFLMEWGSTAHGGSDQGAVHELISKLLLNKTEHETCLKIKNYFQWNKCIRTNILNLEKSENPRVMLYSRAQAFVRDGWTTKFRWGHQDFMFHAMKRQDDVLFTRKLIINECSNTNTLWAMPLQEKYYISQEEEMRKIWENVDKHYISRKEFSIINTIAKCWPRCPNIIR